MSETKSKWNAKSYEENFSFVYEYGQDLLELLKPQSHQRILDLGCGTGQLTSLISKSGAEVIGMDKSAEMIQTARDNYTGLKFVQDDAAYFSFDLPFDIIFSNATLHWVLDHRACIQCMYENLKPKGRLVLEFGGKGNIQNIIGSLRKILAKRGFEKQAKLNLWYFPSVGEYAIALEEAGFRVNSAWHFQRPTVLKDDLISWLDMFANPFFDEIPPALAMDIKRETQEMAGSNCFVNDQWIADYWRIRILAEKPPA